MQNEETTVFSLVPSAWTLSSPCTHCSMSQVHSVYQLLINKKNALLRFFVFSNGRYLFCFRHRLFCLISLVLHFCRSGRRAHHPRATKLSSRFARNLVSDIVKLSAPDTTPLHDLYFVYHRRVERKYFLDTDTACNAAHGERSACFRAMLSS